MESLVSRPHASGLCEDSLLRLRALLVAELRAHIRRAAEHEATASQLQGQLDVDSMLERELAEAAAARAREAICDIEGAVERVAAGTYGLCEACGAAIPLERLEAIPQARLCVACPTRLGHPVRSSSSSHD
jgi:DnaK suppressor protein